jgi:hypothetical protein
MIESEYFAFRIRIRYNNTGTDPNFEMRQFCTGTDTGLRIIAFISLTESPK